GAETGEGGARDGARGAAAGGAGQDVLGQIRDVGHALAQRRDADGDDVQPVVEVLAELAASDQALEVAVGGGDDADVDLAGLLVADPADLVLLEDAQEAGLHGEAGVGDLAEEEGAAVGHLEEAAAVAV